MILPIRRALSTILVLLTASAASAQQTTDKPDVRNKDSFVDKVQRFIKEKHIAERLAPRDGLYPRFKGLVTGSGFAAGAGYRRHLFDDRLFADASMLLSTKKYKAIDTGARWYRFWDDRVELWSEYRYRDFPEEDFFGMGPLSHKRARSNYSITSHDIVTKGVVTLRPWLRVGADLGYFMPTVGPGADPDVPSLETVFTDAQAPGWAAQPNFVHNGVFAEVDTRDDPGRPTTGGLYRATFSHWDDRRLEKHNFRRVDAEALRFFPVAERHVVAFRVGTSVMSSRNDGRVPFYFFPYVGGADTVRGYREYRFRDENMMFLNAEYRWDASDHLEIAPFFDAGTVAHDWDDLMTSRLRTARGIGFRLHANRRVFFRIDIGTGGGEGWNCYVKFGPAF